MLWTHSNALQILKHVIRNLLAISEFIKYSQRFQFSCNSQYKHFKILSQLNVFNVGKFTIFGCKNMNRFSITDMTPTAELSLVFKFRKPSLILTHSCYECVPPYMRFSFSNYLNDWKLSSNPFRFKTTIFFYIMLNGV